MSPETRALFFPVMLLLALDAGCASVSNGQKFEKVKRYVFPKSKAFVGNVERPYTIVGTIRTKVTYNSLNPLYDEQTLCVNFYNKGVHDLVMQAKKVGAEAVIKVQTVTYTPDGKFEVHQTPECTDDGEESEVLLEGVAVNWGSAPPSADGAQPPLMTPGPEKTPAPAPVPIPEAGPASGAAPAGPDGEAD